MKLMIRDFNAQVRIESTFQPLIDKRSLHDVNDDGLRMITSTVSRGLILGSTLFLHKRIHMLTWKSNDNVATNQADHILMSARLAFSLKDARAYREAKIEHQYQG